MQYEKDASELFGNVSDSENICQESDIDSATTCSCNKKKSGRRNLTIHSKSTHAEEMAIDKLVKSARRSRRPSRKIIDVSLMVIRMSSRGTPQSFKLGNSKPCLNCIHRIDDLIRYGYRVTKIYYSDCDNTITSTSLQKLSSDKSVRASSFYRNTNIPKYLENITNKNH